MQLSFCSKEERNYFIDNVNITDMATVRIRFFRVIGFHLREMSEITMITIVGEPLVVVLHEDIMYTITHFHGVVFTCYNWL